MGYTCPAFAPASKDTASLILIGSLLFGETSALYQDLVLKEQLVDSVDGQIDPHRDAYPFLITARLKRASDLPAVRTRIDAAIESARNELVDEARLNDVKSNMKYGFLMGLNSTRGVAMNLITPLQLAGRMSAIDTYYATIDSITPADLQATARTYFVADRLTVATLTSGGK
jgi:zinc protease